MTHNLVTMIAFPALAAYSASAELLSRRRASRLSLGLVGAFVALGLMTQMPMGQILSGLGCALAVLCVTFALFCFGWISSGDAKLVAATSAWLGWDHLVDYALFAMVLGLGLSIVLDRWRARPLSPALARQAWLTRLHDDSGQIPYGVAAAIAGIVLYPGAQDWLRIVTGVMTA